MKEVYVDQENLKKGLYALEDTTKAPFGTARIMKNMQITDRGGVAPRNGIKRLGAADTNNSKTNGIYNFRRSFSQDEILLKPVADKLYGYSKDFGDSGWFLIKDNLSNDKEFGFVTSLVNIRQQDYVIFCNRFDPYMAWSGAITKLNGAVSAGATTVTVDSTLAPDIYESKTATSSTDTTLEVSGAPWATDMWKGAFYVHITSGAQAGQIRKITGNSANTLLFENLPANPVNPDFEIRFLAFPRVRFIASTVTFNDSDPDTITSTSNKFRKVGFVEGMKIKVSGSSSNDGIYTIKSVTEGEIVLEEKAKLTAEASGATVTITDTSMTIVYAGQELQYTDIKTATSFEVGSAHAGSDNDVVCAAPIEFPSNPRGNRLTNYLGRIVVGNVRSALSKGTGTTEEGFAAGGSVFVSRINNPFDFAFDANRLAGQGDIISTPYGGGGVTDVNIQEENFYIFKKRYIESVSYSQNSNDLAIRDPLKAEIGSVNRVIKGADDLYFMTPDNSLTSIGRVAARDIKPQTKNIGYPIKRIIDQMNPEDFTGFEYQNKIYFSARETKDFDSNNIIVVYNKEQDAFEGTWDISAHSFNVFDDKPYFGSSQTGDVFEFNTGKADVLGDNRYPIYSKYASHFFNLTPSKVNMQAVNAVYFEGYITGSSEVTFLLWKDLQETPFLSFKFNGAEENFLSDAILGGALGSSPLSLSPLGSISKTDSDGRRHFSFRVYFPYQYGNYFSVGWEMEAIDSEVEIVRYAMAIKEDTIFNKNVKVV